MNDVSICGLEVVCSLKCVLGAQTSITITTPNTGDHRQVCRDTPVTPARVPVRGSVGTGRSVRARSPAGAALPL